MQKATQGYKEAMKLPLRHRGYIRARIGVVDAMAQENVEFNDSRNSLTYFSTPKKMLIGEASDRIYATFEQNFSKVDGSMYLLPREDAGMEYYNSGIVTNDIRGSVYITFNGITGFYLKGLTIDFGEYYPTKLRITCDTSSVIYDNDKRIFVTEDTFDNVSYFLIEPLEMVNGQGRMRIYDIVTGIANTFTNHHVKSYSFKDYVSPIADSIPSQDMTLVVNNFNLYYSPDNPDSALAYMAQEQEISVEFGYDVTGLGDIEFIKANNCYLKTWSANDSEAKFQAVDIFDYRLKDKYYNGLYRPEGITLYDLALDVFASAGMTSGYYVDNYLRRIVVNNPMPAVSQAQALQIIANAGRCTLSVDRDKRICLISDFVPDSYASVNNKMPYSHIDKLMTDTAKRHYAEMSHDYSLVDGSMYLIGDPATNTGYVSESIYVNGAWQGEPPQITIDFESEWSFFGLTIMFANVAPQEFEVVTYLRGTVVQRFMVNDPPIQWFTPDEFDTLDKLVVTFTKGPENSRVFVDSFLIGDVTDYTLERTPDLQGAPNGTRQNRIKSIGVNYTQYFDSDTDIRDLKQGEIDLPAGETTETFYFPNPAYGFVASIKEGDATIQIVDNSSYYVTVLFSSSNGGTVKYAISGYEYRIVETPFIKPYNALGEEIMWSNPLIGNTAHAGDMAEWLATYFLGDVEYDIDWRGDPRVDANDLFYLELKDRATVLIRAYQNELSFNGGWTGSIKARKAVVSWR